MVRTNGKHHSGLDRASARLCACVRHRIDMGHNRPIFGYSDTWQLVINTGTTIITFLMVFLIQNTQNRDTLALQLKLSEVILALKGADNKMAAIEDASDEELEVKHDKVKAKAKAS